MLLKEGELRKYRSIRGKLFLVENDNGELKAYKLVPTTPTKEMEHMFKTGEKKKVGRELPEEWCGHEFTHEERCRLMVGEDVFASDFVSSKTGKPFSASIVWNGYGFDVKFPKREKSVSEKNK